MADELTIHDVEESTATFAANILRFMAGGSTKYDMWAAMVDIAHVLANAEDKKGAQEAFLKTLRIEWPDYRSKGNEIEHAIDRVKMYGLRLAANHFRDSPAQRYSSRHEILGQLDLINLYREDNRRAAAGLPRRGRL